MKPHILETFKFVVYAFAWMGLAVLILNYVVPDRISEIETQQTYIRE